jgi:hypothetical protein
MVGFLITIEYVDNAYGDQQKMYWLFFKFTVYSFGSASSFSFLRIFILVTHILLK